MGQEEQSGKNIGCSGDENLRIVGSITIVGQEAA